MVMPFEPISSQDERVLFVKGVGCKRTGATFGFTSYASRVGPNGWTRLLAILLISSSVFVAVHHGILKNSIFPGPVPTVLSAVSPMNLVRKPELLRYDQELGAMYKDEDKRMSFSISHADMSLMSYYKTTPGRRNPTSSPAVFQKLPAGVVAVLTYETYRKYRDYVPDKLNINNKYTEYKPPGWNQIRPGLFERIDDIFADENKGIGYLFPINFGGSTIDFRNKMTIWDGVKVALRFFEQQIYIPNGFSKKAYMRYEVRPVYEQAGQNKFVFQTLYPKAIQLCVGYFSEFEDALIGTEPSERRYGRNIKEKGKYLPVVDLCNWIDVKIFNQERYAMVKLDRTHDKNLWN